jgi:chemotaxis protein methyltransferase CheR
MSSTHAISQQLRELLVELIAQKIGIKIRNSEYQSLEQKIWLRIKALELSTPEQYYQLLKLPGVDGEREWQCLTELLTNNESYFFRDREQLNLLKTQIFPEIIQQKRQQNDLTLRIWSAGCAAGQEPYSLAIILRELLIDFDAWKVSIFGSDIDLGALNQARGGIYSPWSFRETESRIKQQYFESQAGNYRIVPWIRQMVSFHKLNLLSEAFPQLFSQLREIDLIVCRNVFIYFDVSAIEQVLAKFSQTLVSGGYLLVGHSELTGQNLSNFQVQIFSQSLIYQRRELNSSQKNSQLLPTQIQTSSQSIQNSPRSRSSNLKQPSAIDPATKLFNPSKPAASNLTPEQTQKLLQQAEKLWQQKQSNLAIKKAEQILLASPQNTAVYCLLGKIYLELGQIELATQMGDRALALEPLNLEINYLLAEIALLQGELAAAKKIYTKILYLDTEAIVAQIQLSQIYRQEGNIVRARKISQQAVKMLQKLPKTQLLTHCNNSTVAELMFQLQANNE